MRRMTDMEVLKSNASLILFAVILILGGILMPMLPVLFPAAEYYELIDKEITVQSVKWISAYRGAGHWRITAEDGERYNITGSYNSGQTDIQEVLCSAENVTVKYYERKGLIKTQKYAEVILVDDRVIVHYDNDEEQPLWPLYMMSGLSILLGTGVAWIVAWSVKNNRRKQANRDRKIIKKYGSFRK